MGNKIKNIVSVEVEKDPFFDCMHGYIFANSEYNLYLHHCDLGIECNCKGCKDFEEKPKDFKIKPVEDIKSFILDYYDHLDPMEVELWDEAKTHKEYMSIMREIQDEF